MTTAHVSLPLDHVGWLIDDLGAARAALTSLGFSVTAPGTLKTGQANHETEDVGQHSAHVMFPDTYLELTSVLPGARPPHLQPYMDSGGGLIILALRVGQAAAAQRSLGDLGISVTPVAHSERPVSYAAPGKSGLARFHWFMCKPAEFPELLVCYVEHVTPDLVFQPTVAQHANGACALRELLLVHADVGEAAGRFQRLAAVNLGPQAGAGVTLLDPAAAERRFPLLNVAGQARAIGVGIEVTDLRVLNERVLAAGGQVDADEDRSWCPGPGGTVLEFRHAGA